MDREELIEYVAGKAYEMALLHNVTKIESAEGACEAYVDVLRKLGVTDV